MKKYKTLLVLTITALVVLLACKKEKPELNPAADPCACASEVSADFTIWEKTGLTSNALATETDTTFKNKYVEFRALEDDAEYTWYIGVDVETTRTTQKLFSAMWAESDIPITLVVKKQPNTACFPDDDGYDSITKTFHISNYVIIDGQNLILGPIEGTYRVHSPHLADSFDVEFYATRIGSTSYFNIINYDGEGSSCINQSRISDANYRQVRTLTGTSTTQCDYIRGYIHNRMDGITEMKFSFGSNNPASPNYYERSYLGRKLH